MSFEPRLFIAIGKDHHFFTLRETYLHKRYVPGDGPMGNAVVNGVYQGSVEYEVRSFHHFNLATSPDEAYAKAVEAAEALGLPLDAKREELASELEAIKRASAEELAARAAAYEAMRAEWAAEREAEHAKDLELLSEGVLRFTKHASRERPKPLSEVPKDFLGWVASCEDFEPDSKMAALRSVLLDKFSALLPPKPVNEFVGAIGKRRDWDVEVLRVSSFQRPAFGSYSGALERVWIVSMIDLKSRCCLVSKSPSFCAEVGEKLRIRGTVKDHQDYKGLCQTVLSRVVELEPVAN